MCRRIENDTSPGKISIPNIRLLFSNSTREFSSISLCHDQHRQEVRSQFLIIQIKVALLTSDPYSKTSPPVRGMMRSPKSHFRSKQKDLLSRKRNDALGQCRISDPNRKEFLHLRGIVTLSWIHQLKTIPGPILPTHADLTQPRLPGHSDQWPKQMSLYLEIKANMISYHSNISPVGKKLTVLCGESKYCLLAIVLIDKWRTSLCRSDRTVLSRPNPSSEQSLIFSAVSLYISEAVRTIQHKYQATKPSNRNPTAHLAGGINSGSAWENGERTTFCYQNMSPQVACHKGSVTRCRSEGPHNSVTRPLIRRTPNNWALWGIIGQQEHNTIQHSNNNCID